MALLDANKPQYNKMLMLSIDVEDALQKDREISLEILKERFWAEVHAMTADQLAARVVNQSSFEQIKELHASLCAPEDDSEISDFERCGRVSR